MALQKAVDALFDSDSGSEIHSAPSAPSSSSSFQAALQRVADDLFDSDPEEALRSASSASSSSKPDSNAGPRLAPSLDSERSRRVAELLGLTESTSEEGAPSPPAPKSGRRPRELWRRMREEREKKGKKDREVAKNTGKKRGKNKVKNWPPYIDTLFAVPPATDEQVEELIRSFGNSPRDPADASRD